MNMIHAAGARTAFLLAAALLAVPAIAANQLQNPDFETPGAIAGDVAGVEGWTEFGEPGTRFLTRSIQAQSGSQSLKMFGPWVQWAGTGMLQAVPALPGQTWVAEIWARNDSRDPMGVGNFCVMKIEFLDSAMGPAGGTWLLGINLFEVRVADEFTPRDIWQLAGLGTAPAPEGTAFARFVIVEVQGSNPPSGGSIFLDNAFFDLYVPPDPCAAHDPVFDTNHDDVVDLQDLIAFQACATGPAIPLAPDATQECRCMDRTEDGDIDQEDFGIFQRCFSGADPAIVGCDD